MLMLVRVGDLRGTGESGPAAAALAEMRCIASQGVGWVTRTSVLVAVVAFALALDRRPRCREGVGAASEAMSSASRSKKLLRAPLSIAGFVAATDTGGPDRRWRRVRALMLAGLVPAALAGAVLFPPAASAATRGFHVYNVSGHPIKFDHICCIGNGATFDSTPAAGAVQQPGFGYDDFEETYYFLSDTQATAVYQILGDDGAQIGTFNATMAVGATGNVGAGCSTDVGTCTPNGDPANNVGQYTFTLLDAPGTVHDIPAGQGQAQRAVLNQLCVNGNAATCTFTATKEDKIDSPDHPVGRALINNTDEEQDTDVTISDTVGATDSVDVGLKVGGKILGVVEVEVSAKYSHEWTREHTFEQRVTVHCRAHYRCWITGTAPMLRDTGEFSLTLANTTWRLHDVYIDSPDPTGQGAYSVNDEPLTAGERASLPASVIQTGTDGNDNLAGTDADDRMYAQSGNDTTHAMAGDDTVSGGAGNDRIFGGPGNDTVSGGPGKDTLNGGPGDDSVRARDGQADRVDCGKGDDTAVLDPKDAIVDATPQKPNGSCQSVDRGNP